MFVSIPTIPISLPGDLHSRPASRAEVLESQLQHNRLHAVSIMESQVLQADVVESQRADVRRRLMGETSSPVSAFRRGISRALMSAAERIGPEAA